MEIKTKYEIIKIIKENVHICMSNIIKLKAKMSRNIAGRDIYSDLLKEINTEYSCFKNILDYLMELMYPKVNDLRLYRCIKGTSGSIHMKFRKCSTRLINELYSIKYSIKDASMDNIIINYKNLINEILKYNHNIGKETLDIITAIEGKE